MELQHSLGIQEQELWGGGGAFCRHSGGEYFLFFLQFSSIVIPCKEHLIVHPFHRTSTLHCQAWWMEAQQLAAGFCGWMNLLARMRDSADGMYPASNLSANRRSDRQTCEEFEVSDSTGRRSARRRHAVRNDSARMTVVGCSICFRSVDQWIVSTLHGEVVPCTVRPTAGGTKKVIAVAIRKPLLHGFKREPKALTIWRCPLF